MKWPLLFIASATLLLASYYYASSSQHIEDTPTSSSRPKNQKLSKERYSEKTKPPLTKAKINKLKQLDVKNLKEEGSSGTPGTLPFQLPLNDPKHFALVDGEGALYPTHLGVDEEYIVAYGDVIVGDSAQIERIQAGEETVKVPRPKIWPGTELPYRLSPDVTDAQKEAIAKIGNILDSEGIIKMRPYDPLKDQAYVYFKQGSSHCYAQVGYNGGVTQVALNEKCGYAEIFHEVFHVLGFFHEQNRHDRDEHVKVLWENIEEEHWPQFEKFPEESLPEVLQNQREVPFSFKTFMLYRPTAFSNNSDYSMVTVYGDPYAVITEPSQEDFRRARLLYGRQAR